MLIQDEKLEKTLIDMNVSQWLHEKKSDKKGAVDSSGSISVRLLCVTQPSHS